jgi:hypothetical protein
MSRPRMIPDAQVFASILRLIAEGGEKAVAFSSVARATGLAAPSLVQRYGALPDMIHAALQGEWDRIDAATATAMAEVNAAAKGTQALLKALSPAPSAAFLAATARDAKLRERARLWRAEVEAGLIGRFGDPELAAILFAAWQGQSLWTGIGDKSFKLKDVIKRLG